MSEIIKDETSEEIITESFDADLEDEFEEHIADKVDDKDLVLTDSAKLWLKEIGKYPLLSIEEEKKYGTDLKLRKGILYEKANIDIDKVFILLENSKYNEDILKYLYSLFSSLNSENNSIRINKIQKYINLKNKLGRFLNKEELNKYFGINESFELDDSLFLKDINNYVIYMNARDKMICSNLRLASSMAKTYAYKSGKDFMDLAMEASIGLITAVEKFEVDYGNRFSTFATWWIRQSMSKYVAKNMSDFKVTISYYRQVKDFREEVNRLEKERKRQLTVDELVDITGKPREDIIDLLTYDNRALSLDQRVSDEDDSSVLGDFIEDESISIDEDLLKMDLRNSLESVFKYLKPDEIKVIKLYYGIDCERRYSIKEIGKKMGGKTSGRINTLLNTAVIKMQRVYKKDEDILRLKMFLK